MLYREIIAVCSQIHTKHINTLCGQNVELLNVKHDGTYSDHWALKGQSIKPPNNSAWWSFIEMTSHQSGILKARYMAVDLYLT